MAIADKVSLLKLRNRLRPAHLDDAVAFFDGETENTYEAADQTSAKTGLIDAQNTVVDTFESTYTTGLNTQKTGVDDLFTVFKGMWPFESEAAFIDAADTLATGCKGLMDAIPADFATLKTDLAAEVTTGITASVTVDFTDMFTAAKAIIVPAIGDYTEGGVPYFPYEDQQCKGTGRHQYKLTNEGSANTTQIHCTGCDGIGRTHVLRAPFISDWGEEAVIPEIVP